MNFVDIKSTQDLADYFELDYNILARITYGPSRSNLYKVFEIPKKSGGSRIIHSPEKTLRVIQRKLADELKQHYRRHDAAFGFVDKYSITDNASKHINQDWVLNLDLADFFPSIHFGRIRGLFQKPPFAFPDKVAQWIAQLATFNGTLPQWAPSSPILTNMICLRLDKDLKKLARRHALSYTRYADDITLSSKKYFPKEIAKMEKSGNESLATLGADIVSIIEKNGFKVNPSKTRLVSKSGCQEVTGIVVNEKSNLPRHYINTIRGEIGQLRFLDGEEENALQLRVLGRLGHLKKVVGEFDPRYIKLKAKLHGIKLSCSPNETMYRAVNWIVENDDGIYGTAFHIDHLGWITACHVATNPAEIMNFKLFHPDDLQNKYAIQLKSNLFDADIDYVIFNAPIKPIISAKIASKQIDNGEACVLSGYPNHNNENNSVSIIEAKITSTQTIFKAPRFVVDANIFHGMSGGSVFNKENQLIGLVTHGNKDGGTTVLQSAFTSIHLVLNDISNKSPQRIIRTE